MTATASDSIGRSVPAPGKGVLTSAREHAAKAPSPLLDMKYRRAKIERRKKQINQEKEAELEYLAEEIEAMKAQGTSFNEKEYLADRVAQIEKQAVKEEKDALRSLGNNFWRSDPTIAPIRGALATWGLTIDDLDVASFHGTSTKANDKNESSVICQQLTHLGRQKGNAILGIFQKYLTGHPKGAAGAWMMNGCLQILNTGLVPGNRNADNVDPVMEQFDYIVYPNRSIQTDGIKAFSVTSFGFGQKGAQAIGVHPKYLYAVLDEQTYNAYAAKVAVRQKKAYRYFHNGMINKTLFVAKSTAPYTDEQLPSVLLNPDARVTENKKTKELTYPKNFSELADKAISANAMTETAKHMVDQLTRREPGVPHKVGIDIEDVAAINIDNDTFIRRNFTDNEVRICRTSPSPRSSFAGRWSAKEAVFKALGVSSKGAGAPLKDIEILKEESGAPSVALHGDAEKAARQAGMKDVTVSISHSDGQAVAIAIATFQ